MDSNTLHKDFQKFCQQNADEAIVKKYARYFKETHNAWGIRQELMEGKAKEIMGMNGFTVDGVLEAAPLFFKNGKYEETALILMLLNRNTKKFDEKTFRGIEGFFSKGIYNWAHADMLGMSILPEFLMKEIVVLDAFKPWITSPYKFQRRCVPVTLIKPMKRGAPVAPYLKFVEPLMKDAEREVHQGVGWFLREAWKIDPQPVEQFLMKYKETSARLIFQYACEKMRPEQRETFRRSKK